MTTLLPGASEVLTQGFRSRPRSTAFLASSAAATMTVGLEVLVHEVIAAMTTAPWSISVCVPSASVTAVGRLARVRAGTTDSAAPGGGSCSACPGHDRGCVGGGEALGRRLVRHGEQAVGAAGVLLVGGRVVGEDPEELLARLGQRDPVLGSLRPGDARDDLEPRSSSRYSLNRGST